MRYASCALALMTFQSQPILAQTIKAEIVDNKSWRTFYFGRFKVDLPSDAEISADYKIYNENIELISKNGRAQITSITAKTIAELKKGSAYGTASIYEKTIPLNNGSILLLSKIKNLYTFHVYLLTSKNTLYLMMARAVSAKGLAGAIDKAKDLSDHIFFRMPQDAPPPGSFALEAGYTTLDPTQPLEGIYMGAQIPTHPGTFVSLLTQQIAEHEENLIKRFENNKGSDLADGMAELMNKTKTLRKRERMIGSIKAEEVAVTAVINGKRFYTFQIEYEGTLESNTKPFIDFKLGTHEIGSDFKSDEEALTFWDRVVDSLRPLP